MTRKAAQKRAAARAEPTTAGYQDDQVIDIFQQAFARWADKPPMAFALEMPRDMVLSLIGALQIMARQEQASPSLRNAIIEIGRGLQKQVCDVPELYLVIDSGWPPPRNARSR